MKNIPFKRIMFKCYIDGKIYFQSSDESYTKRQYNAYHKDLVGHMLDGSWEKAMTPNTSEYNKYLYNLRMMNDVFSPKELNKSDKADIKWSTKKYNLLSKFRMVNR